MVARWEAGSGKVTVRHAEVGDAEAFHRIMTAPRVVAGTLQLPLQTVERTRRFLADPPRGILRAGSGLRGRGGREPGPEGATRQPASAPRGRDRLGRPR